MKVTQVQIPARLTVVATLAQLLQRLEVSRVPVDPQQYRSVAQRLADALKAVPSDTALDAILGVYPAAAELYENLQYQHAGLCRAPLEASLNSELQARDAIDRAAGRGAGTPAA
jgi:2-methylisocitrate lyase-like PEP mutase family enzyme